MKSLPTPSDMLEELAAQVIAQMNKQAITSFESSFDEMVDFHKFLIAAYTAVPGSITDSYAHINFTSVFGSAPYEKWNREYTSILEKAAENIGVENDYIAHLSRLPLSLMPRKYSESSENIILSLLDPSLYLAHRIGDWVSQRRIRNETGSAEHYLSGLDRKAYEDALSRVVGGWENVLMAASTLYGLNEANKVSASHYWKALHTSWPYLARHLRNTGYMVVASVWNDDPIGTRDYAESFMGWRNRLSHVFDGGHALPRARFITADIFSSQWQDVQLDGHTFLRHEHIPAVDLVFSKLLENTHRDTITIVTGVMAGWIIEGKTHSRLAAQTIKGLLDGTLVGEERYSIVRTNFTQLMLNLIRMNGIASYRDQDRYASYLDNAVDTFDRMTERRVLNGRAFTPSTKHNRDDLVVAWTLLAAERLSLDLDQAARFKHELAEVVGDESIFPDADDGVRRSQRFIQSMKDSVPDAMRRSTGFIEDNHEDLAALLETTLSEASAIIQQKRTARIQERQADPAKLHALERAISDELVQKKSYASVFVQAETVVSTNTGEALTRRYNLSKGDLVSPSMAIAPNLESLQRSCATAVSSSLSTYLFTELMELTRVSATLADERDYWEHVQIVSEYIDAPVVLVGLWYNRRSSKALMEANWTFNAHKRVEIVEYMGTYGTVDIYKVNHAPLVQELNRGILFSRSILKRINLHPVEDNRLVTASFEETDDPWNGKLVIQFAPELEWDNSPEVIELCFPKPETDLLNEQI